MLCPSATKPREGGSIQDTSSGEPAYGGVTFSYLMVDSQWRGGPNTSGPLRYSIPTVNPDDAAYDTLQNADREMEHFFVPRHKSGVKE